MKKPPKVKVVYLESCLDGAKVGFDDFLAQGGIIAKLLAQATTEPRPLPKEQPEVDLYQLHIS